MSSAAPRLAAVVLAAALGLAGLVGLQPEQLVALAAASVLAAVVVRTGRTALRTALLALGASPPAAPPGRASVRPRVRQQAPDAPGRPMPRAPGAPPLPTAA